MHSVTLWYPFLQSLSKCQCRIRPCYDYQAGLYLIYKVYICIQIVLKFGSEAWVLKKREEQRLEAAQMTFLRHLLGITKPDKEKNQCIREKTGAENIVKEIKQYQEKWLQHIQRMDTNRIPKQALQYKPKGRRHEGRPRKRWRDQFHFEDTRNRNQT